MHQSFTDALLAVYCAFTRAPEQNKSSAVAEMGDCFATIDMG